MTEILFNLLRKKDGIFLKDSIIFWSALGTTNSAITKQFLSIIWKSNPELSDKESLMETHQKKGTVATKFVKKGA